MPTPPGAYCATEDLRTGDIATPSYTSRDQYVTNAAEEIDAALGHLYVTPFVIDNAVPTNRPSILFLKKINWLLASGRLILDVAAAGETDSLHAYGKRMLDEAMGMLGILKSGELVLTGAQKIESDTSDKDFTGPVIHNEDAKSLVEGFYTQRQRPAFGVAESYPFGYPMPVVPYGK